MKIILDIGNQQVIKLLSIMLVNKPIAKDP